MARDRKQSAPTVTCPACGQTSLLDDCDGLGAEPGHAFCPAPVLSFLAGRRQTTCLFEIPVSFLPPPPGDLFTFLE